MRDPRLQGPIPHLVSTTHSELCRISVFCTYPDMSKGGTERARTVSAKSLGDFLDDMDDDRGEEIEEDCHPFTLWRC